MLMWAWVEVVVNSSKEARWGCRQLPWVNPSSRHLGWEVAAWQVVEL
jgi:hypothetical protein